MCICSLLRSVYYILVAFTFSFTRSCLCFGGLQWKLLLQLQFALQLHFPCPWRQFRCKRVSRHSCVQYSDRDLLRTHALDVRFLQLTAWLHIIPTKKIRHGKMVSLESIGEQFAEMGIEPAPAILGRCKYMHGGRCKRDFHIIMCGSFFGGYVVFCVSV